MRKFYLLLLAGSCLFVSCNPKDTKDKDEDEDTETVTGKKEKEEAKDDISKATVELCNCLNNTLEDMDPRVRKIIIKAGNSDDPENVLRMELQKITDANEQQQLANEFQAFQDNDDMQKCSDKIKKKYDIDENDKKAQKKLMRVAEENEDCELLYALMKIGMQQQEKGNTE